MNVLIIDNYDSFTYNLYQYVGELLAAQGDPLRLVVKRNDEISFTEIQNARFDRIIISPGPGDPKDPDYFGVCADVLTTIGQSTPVLGVCLGMQGMAHYFGGKVVRAKVPMHGKTSPIVHDGRGVFDGIPQDIEVMRYHSLVAERSSIPPCLTVTAYVQSGSQSFAAIGSAVPEAEIMGLRHTTFPIEGIQFHPESFATEAGKQMIANFLFSR